MPDTQQELQDQSPEEAPVKFVQTETEAPPSLEMQVTDARPAGFEDPVPATPVETARQREEREYHERARARLQEFVDKVRAVNKSENKPIVVQPVNPHIQKRTNDEIAAGRKAAAAHAAARAANPPAPHKKEPWEGSSTEVFRPADYVPDPRKGQGQVHTQPVG